MSTFAFFLTAIARVQFLVVRQFVRQLVQSCSVKKLFQKIFKFYQKNVSWSQLLTNSRPRACNSIQIESLTHVFSSDICEIYH